MSDNGDNHVVDDGARWTFDEKVTASFDAMLADSIPSYETMRALCFNLGKNFIHDGSIVIDLGASRGLSVQRFIDYTDEKYPMTPGDVVGHINQGVRYVLFEISSPMMAVLHEKYGSKPNIKLQSKDITERDNIFHQCSQKKASLIMSILTIQFTPIEYRLQILDEIYESLEPGGAFIFVEKVIGNSAKIDRLMVQEYLNLKAGNGYTAEQINKKRKSLEGVLVPMTAQFNEEMLRGAGFRQVDCFYRHLNFAGWIAIK